MCEREIRHVWVWVGGWMCGYRIGRVGVGGFGRVGMGWCVCVDVIGACVAW